MVAVQKRSAGGDSFGNYWPADGAIIDVPIEQAAVLVSIRDSGCTIVNEAPPIVDPPVDITPTVDADPPADPPPAIVEAETPVARKGATRTAAR